MAKKKFHFLPAGSLVVAGVLALGISLTSVADVPRYTQVTPPQDSLLACVPQDSGRLLADGHGELLVGEDAEPRAVPIDLPVDAVTTIRGVAPSGGVLGEALYSPCQAPATSGFVALPDAARAELVLTNTDSTDAAVDLTLLGPDGEILGLGARGIALAPGESRPVALSVIADGVDGPLGVEWHTTRGRVVAAGVTIDGPAHVAGSGIPATGQVLPGVNGAGARVVIVNPGIDRAAVSVEFHAPTTTFTPEGGQDISVPPRSTVVVDLGGATGEDPGAFTLTSDVEVVATLYSAGTEYQAAATSAVPDVELVGAVPGSSTLQLTNVGEVAADVTIRLGGEIHDIRIEPGTTATQAVGATPVVDVDITSTMPLVGAAVTADAIIALAPGSLAEPEPVDAELVPTLR